jgi:hypothetical protein
LRDHPLFRVFRHFPVSRVFAFLKKNSTSRAPTFPVVDVMPMEQRLAESVAPRHHRLLRPGAEGDASGSDDCAEA